MTGASPPVIPEGFVLVPREPTGEMCCAIFDTDATGVCPAVALTQDASNASVKRVWAAMISSAPPVPEPAGGWRTDMENAPRDGTWFIAVCPLPAQVRVVHWADKYDRLPISGDNTMWSALPTHWMPLPPDLPPPPTALLGGEEDHIASVAGATCANAHPDTAITGKGEA